MSFGLEEWQKYYMSMSDKNMKKLVLYGKMSPYSQSHQNTSLYDLIWIGRMTKCYMSISDKNMKHQQ